jgi:hypothetical protein
MSIRQVTKWARVLFAVVLAGAILGLWGDRDALPILIVAGPITLLDVANGATSPVKQTFIMGLVEKMWTLGEKLPFVPASAVDGALFSRTTELPGLQWRKIGQPSVAVQSRRVQFREGLRLIREHIDIDSALVNDPSAPNEVRFQMETVQESIGYGFNDAAINGDPTVDPEQPTGLDYRLRNDPVFHGGVAAGNDRGQVIDSAGLDVDANSTNMHNWLDNLHELVRRCDGKVDAFLANGQTIFKLASILRREKQLQTTTDLFDRQIDMFARVPLVDLGVKPAGAVTKATGQQIFPHNTQTSPFAATANTSWVGAVRIDDTRFTGLQREAIKVDEIGVLPNDPSVHRIAYIEWLVAMAALQRNAAAANYGLVI